MLEEKIDLLTKEIVALRKSLEAGGGSPRTAAAADEPAADKPKRGRPAKAAPAEPEHDKDEVEKIIREVSREVGRPVAKKIIQSFKCEDLADLLTHPEHFDAAFTAAEEALAAPAGDEEEDI